MEREEIRLTYRNRTFRARAWERDDATWEVNIAEHVGSRPQGEAWADWDATELRYPNAQAALEDAASLIIETVDDDESFGS